MKSKWDIQQTRYLTKTGTRWEVDGWGRLFKTRLDSPRITDLESFRISENRTAYRTMVGRAIRARFVSQDSSVVVLLTKHLGDKHPVTQIELTRSDYDALHITEGDPVLMVIESISDIAEDVVIVRVYFNPLSTDLLGLPRF